MTTTTQTKTSKAPKCTASRHSFQNGQARVVGAGHDYVTTCIHCGCQKHVWVAQDARIKGIETSYSV